MFTFVCDMLGPLAISTLYILQERLFLRIFSQFLGGILSDTTDINGVPQEMKYPVAEEVLSNRQPGGGPTSNEVVSPAPLILYLRCRPSFRAACRQRVLANARESAKTGTNERERLAGDRRFRRNPNLFLKLNDVYPARRIPLSSTRLFSSEEGEDRGDESSPRSSPSSDENSPRLLKLTGRVERGFLQRIATGATVLPLEEGGCTHCLRYGANVAHDADIARGLAAAGSAYVLPALMLELIPELEQRMARAIWGMGLNQIALLSSWCWTAACSSSKVVDYAAPIPSRMDSAEVEDAVTSLRTNKNLQIGEMNGSKHNGSSERLRQMAELDPFRTTDDYSNVEEMLANLLHLHSRLVFRIRTPHNYDKRKKSPSAAQKSDEDAQFATDQSLKPRITSSETDGLLKYSDIIGDSAPATPAPVVENFLNNKSLWEGANASGKPATVATEDMPASTDEGFNMIEGLPVLLHRMALYQRALTCPEDDIATGDKRESVIREYENASTL